MKKTLNLAGQILDLSSPKVMGILNATPDSFLAKSRVLDRFRSVVDQMVSDNVDILDVGGYSTRPGAKHITISEEIDRVLPVIEYIASNHPQIPISIDSFRHEVIIEVLKIKHVIVNDVSGGDLDSNMWNLIAEKRLPYILMHMRGNPQTMQNEENVTYTDIVEEVLKKLQEKVLKLNKMGVFDIIVDPGIGFAKEQLDNFKIIKALEVFKLLSNPVLIGVSRKSFIWKTLDCKAEDTLVATCALHALALQSGVSILRVHDVAEAVQVRDIMLTGNLL